MLMAMPSPANDINDEGDDGGDYSQPLLFTQPMHCGLPPLPADDSFDSAINDTAAKYAAVATAAVVATASKVIDSLPWPWRQRDGGAGQHGGGNQHGNGICSTVLAVAVQWQLWQNGGGSAAAAQQQWWWWWWRQQLCGSG
jgi:hypothetical protein